MIPQRPRDRIKTDRRDASSLSKLHRAGELTAVSVPDTAQEAMRDLVPAHLEAVHALRRAHQQLFRGFCAPGLLLRAMRPRPGRIGDGSRVCALSRQCIASCLRITLRRSKPPTPAAIERFMRAGWRGGSRQEGGRHQRQLGATGLAGARTAAAPGAPFQASRDSDFVPKLQNIVGLCVASVVAWSARPRSPRRHWATRLVRR